MTARMSAGGTSRSATPRATARCAAAPAASPSCIIVRESLQLDAAIAEKLAHRPATRTFSAPFGTMARYGISYHVGASARSSRPVRGTKHRLTRGGAFRILGPVP